MEISAEEYQKHLDEQVGKPCKTHGSIIKKGKYGNWCGYKTSLGTWCTGNDYPMPKGETLMIKHRKDNE